MLVSASPPRPLRVGRGATTLTSQHPAESPHARASGREVAPGALAGRRFLLVTLPAGPFSRVFARFLRDAGAETWRVILNGGDLLDWGFRRGLWAVRKFSSWPDFIGDLIVQREVTDVVVFGDATSYSAGAVAAAHRAGIRLWVMENGYRRPNWVTIETCGVNANSGLPRVAAAYADVDMRPLGDPPGPVGAITPFHALNVFDYFAGVILGWPFFRRYRYPYALRIWPQAFGHAGRYFNWLVSRRARDHEARLLVEGSQPFFLACLQRDGDSQLLLHSELKSNRAFMAEVIASFAADAPKDMLLVVKNHPLDPGVENLARACVETAERHGVGDRVRFLDGGAFAPLAHRARGIVAVNSTAAFAALDFGAPVKLLGRALFAIEGLVNVAPLADFWRAPAPPDTDLLARFRRRLSLRTQVWGSFHNPRAMKSTARGVVARIITPDTEFLA